MKNLIRSSRIHPLLAGGFSLLGFCVLAGAADFKPIFDGQSLNGWQAPNMTYWSVEDGAITAQSSEAHPCTNNQFIVWQLGQVDDFELKLHFRLFGGETANSGIQIRGDINPDGHVIGYQADMDRGVQWLGGIYDEHMPRKVLAAPGQKTEIDAWGNRKTSDAVPFETLLPGFNPEAWNEYHITAEGGHLTVRINGKVTSEVFDGEVAEREFSGVLALQIHSGPPMKVQFKDIELKRLPLSDGRKKIVFLAGSPSHGPGEHEHNAGCLLLAKQFNDYAERQALGAVYLNNGWPADPTAFDNADAVIVYADGNSRHPLSQNLAAMEELHKRGVGLGCIHYAVEMPKDQGGQNLMNWIGGFFEVYRSINPHWDADYTILPAHPITRGVHSYKIRDEWYYDMHFRDDMEGVTPILSALPPEETRTDRWGHDHGGNEHVKARSGMLETTMWAAESQDGGRGFGFTGGHFHKNWGDINQRTVVLNACLWVAGGEVPITGVPSHVTEEELTLNLDPKPARKKK